MGDNFGISNGSILSNRSILPGNELFLFILRRVWYFLPFILYLICMRCNLARRNLRIKNHLFWQTCPNEANYCRSKASVVVNVVRVSMTRRIQQVPRLSYGCDCSRCS